MRRSRVISPSLASASAIAAPTLSQLHRLGLRLKQGHTRSQSRSRSRSRKHSLNFLGLIVLVSAIGSLFPVVLGKCGEGKLKISLHKPRDMIKLYFILKFFTPSTKNRQHLSIISDLITIYAVNLATP